ncbi:MAG: outer membrane beta-barrel protein [Ancalomicrobiaceae bacterium]|nr:outer membrane beta-barrel protein [Ancalomicrobiaceae bacterium]
MSQVSFTRNAIALTALGLVTFGAPAWAADLNAPQPYPPAQPYAGYTQQSPVANWAGAYLGVHAGYSFGSLSNNVPGVGKLSSSINGALIGVYGGVNAVLSGNIIVGAEGDLNLSDQRNTQTDSFGNTYKGTSGWNGSVRGRVGTAIDRYMPFLTAGLAFAENKLTVDGVSDSASQVGLAIGAGLEGYVTDRITLKGELLYEGFGDVSHTVLGQTVKTNISSGIFRIGAAYKF